MIVSVIKPFKIDITENLPSHFTYHIRLMGAFNILATVCNFIRKRKKAFANESEIQKVMQFRSSAHGYL